MKLQFNLLPDVKQDYLKAERSKRTVIAAALAAAGLAVVIFIFMLTTVYVINKKNLSDADKDVAKYSQELKSIPNINKILTVQSQLNSLLSLHQNKHVVSRLYQYLPQTTPSNVCMANFEMDTTTNTITIGGTTDSQKSVNTFIDTLKFTTYSLDGQDTKKKAFPSVIESQFGLSGDFGASSTKCAGKPATANYQLTIQYEPLLFTNTNKVALNVPAGLVTTRSVLDDPNTLFTGETGTKKTTTQGAQ